MWNVPAAAQDVTGSPMRAAWGLFYNGHQGKTARARKDAQRPVRAFLEKNTASGAVLQKSGERQLKKTTEYWSTPEGLALAIMNNNEKALTVAPGVGKKIAQRVILELKDKINKGVSEISIPTAQVQTGGAMNDVVAALTVLGYSSSEIAPVLNKLDISSMTTEEAIKTVLRKMTN